MLRRIALFILGVALVTILAAVGLMLAVGSSSAQITKVVAVGVVVIILMVWVARLGRRNVRMNRRVPIVPVQSREIEHMNEERPVMFYKGEPYDFVHNDPTLSEA